MAVFRQWIRVVFQAAVVLTFSSCIVAAESKPWDGPAFKGNPAAIIQSAGAIDAGKGYDATVLLEEHYFSIDSVGRATHRVHWVYRVNTDAGIRSWGSTGMRWEPWRQKQPVIKVRVITADGAEHRLDPATLSDSPERENTPEIYSDTRIYHGPLPAVAIGAVVEVEIVCEDTAPSIQGGTLQRIYFQRKVPMLQARFVLQRPASVSLKYEIRLLPGAAVKQKKLANMLETSIENGSMDAYENIEWNLPSDVAELPQVEFSTFSSWKDVAASYARMAEPQIQPDSVKGMVESVVSPGDAREEKIRKLTAKLHQEIRYTGIEFGESKLVPQPAVEVFKRKYGDCKDKAATLTAMLRAAGVPAYMALLKAGDEQDVSPTLPGGDLFDHVIVYVPGSPEIWIDATDEFSAPGNLAHADQGRKALIISPEMRELKSTPVAAAEDNLLMETREFQLAEFGPARVVERSEARGSTDAFYRSYYGTDKGNKKLQKELEEYIENVYLSDTLDKFETGEGRDLTKPFVMKIEAAKARRGHTSLKDSRMAILPAGIFGRMPDYFKMSEEQLKEERGKASRPQPPRTADYVLPFAFVTEWRYRIIPPIGFKVRALPENRVQEMGPARFTQNFVENPDGSVKAAFVFSTGKARYTAAEAEAVRKGIESLRASSAIIISFDQEGYALLSAGKTKEAIAAFESIVRRHPTEALHHVQLAYGLLEAGLAEDARGEAREAIRLEPQSALAHETMAWILQHDLIGRRLQKGFDLEGAKAEYRRALELDPGDLDTRTDFAILLEHDRDGERYSSSADLKGAVEQYRELQNRKSDWKSLDRNLLLALYYGGQFKEVEALAGKAASDPVVLPIVIAARAAIEGSESAVKKSLELTADEKTRMEALSSAAFDLLAMRLYAPAADLLGRIHTGKASLETVQAIAKTKRYEELEVSEKDPAEYVRKMLIRVIGPATADRRALDMFALEKKPKRKSGKTEADEDYASLRNFGRNLRNMAGRELPVEARGDVFLSTMRLEVEGNENSGFRVQARGMGIEKLFFYVIREPAGYRIQDIRGTAGFGKAVIRCLDKGDLDGARRWLDWVREITSIAGGDDPLAGPVFPRLWRKGQSADKNTLRELGAVLLVGSPDVESLLPVLIAAQKKARDDAARSAWTLALTTAYASLERWIEMRGTTESLMKAVKDSPAAFYLYVLAATQLKDWNAVTRAAKERLELFPKDQDAIAVLSDITDRQGNLAESLNILRAAIKDSSSPSKTLMNNYAWTSLFMDKLPDDAVEYAQRAVRMTGNEDFGIIHTLSAVYAEVDRVGEARQILVDGMEKEGMDEPDSSIWYVFGRIAEQYGRVDAALKVYARIEDESDGLPRTNSTYNLARRRISIIGKQ